jgi:polysaccharide pyruvyl transferase WcaK-like protein
MMKKDIIFWGVSIDIKHEENLKKIKNIFAFSKEIYVRDQGSLETLKKLSLHAEVILDPVFSDNGEI